MSLESFKESVGSFWDNLAEGWKHLTQSASGALTRFRPGETTDMPAKTEVDDVFYLPSRSWSMLGGNVFEDEKRLVVRLEVPGMEKQDMTIEVRDNALIISGEKRFEREDSDGRWRVMQCAYGSFHRVVPLNVPVLADQATAHYKNGVLRVELPKAAPGELKSITIPVE